MNRKNTKALSPVIASIILVAITTTVAITATTWMGSITVGFMDPAGQEQVTNFVLPPITTPTGTDEEDPVATPTPTATPAPSPTASSTPTPTPSPTPKLSPTPITTSMPKPTQVQDPIQDITKKPVRPPAANATR